MKKLSVIVVLIGILLVVFYNWDWITQLREEELSYFTDVVVEELGYGILWITIPLMVIQNIITLFPILILIMLHFISFGMVQGFLFSFAGTTLGALLCFWLARSMGEKSITRFWEKRERKLSYILNLIFSYGVLTIVLLRSIPIMPSNLISFAAAVSPIQVKAYVFSTIVGNISMVWLLSLLSAFLWMDGDFYFLYLISYVLFSIVVIGFYVVRFYRRSKSQLPDHTS